MGYRLYVHCDGDFVELGKFYGYTEFIGRLPSIKWLVDHNKLEEFDNDPNVFNWIGYGPEIKLTALEFKEFFRLYQNDCAFNYLMAIDKLNDFYNNDSPKELIWG